MRRREWALVLALLVVVFRFDHDGAGVTRWDVRVNGVESVIQPPPTLNPEAPKTGAIEDWWWAFSRELAPGRHEVAVRACYPSEPGPCSDWSNTLTLECTETDCTAVPSSDSFRAPGKPRLLPE